MVVSLDRWEGKVAVVTGASAGIGAAIVVQLVSAGLRVVGFARRPEKIQELCGKLKGKRGKLYSRSVDITNEEDIKVAFKWVLQNVGPVSILVNSAGLAVNTTLIDGETEKWKQVFDTNLLGLCIATREAISIMKDNKIDGHIIHINSLAGHSVLNVPWMNVYSASKFGVTSLTETLRQELNSLNSKIKVTSISPGVVKTDIFTSNALPIASDHWKTVPYLQPEDIANAVIYVLSTPPNVQVHELTIKPIGSKH